MAPHAADNFLLSCDNEIPSPVTLSSHHITSATSGGVVAKKSLITPKRQRTVNFAPYNEVLEIVHINDLKEMVDINAIWLSYDEFEAIKANVRKTIQDIENGLELNEDQCARGLETMTKLGRQEKQEKIFFGRQCVLDEQDLQRYEGINDPDLIADVFFDTTYQSQCAAERIALEDRKAIL